MRKVLILLYISCCLQCIGAHAEEQQLGSQFGPGERASFDFFSPNAVRDPLRMNLEVSKQPDYSFFPSRPAPYEFAHREDVAPASAGLRALNGKSQNASLRLPDTKDPVAAELFSEYGDPRERAPVRAIDSAPRPFKGLMAALESGREDIAALYARQFVNHLGSLEERSNQILHLTDDARKLNHLEALTTDQEAPLRVTTNIADISSENMNRDGSVDLYFFFDPADESSISSVQKIERLSQVTRGIEQIRLVGMSMRSTLEPETKQALQAQKLSFLVRDGAELARILKIERFPVLALVSPASGEMHLQQDFGNLGAVFQVIQKLQGAQ